MTSFSVLLDEKVISRLAKLAKRDRNLYGVVVRGAWGMR